jgi:ribose transport system permease protein
VVPSPPLADGAARRQLGRVRPLLMRSATLLAFLAVVIAFSALRPHSFATLENWQSMLNLGAPVIIIAAALTVPLIMGDFDLSIGYNVQLLGAFAIVLVAKHEVATGLGVVATLALGAAIGCMLGALITYSRASAFVITLGAGTIMLGIELKITNGGKTIFEGIPTGYTDIATTKLLGLELPIWIMFAVVVVLTLLTERSVLGRYVAAIGSNRETARLGGVNVGLMRIASFMIVGVGAALAGIILTAQANQYYPNLGVGNLLPAYAAVFLGAATLRPGQFHILGTFIGAVFLQVIGTGLVLMNVPSYVANIIQGSVLVIAVVISRLGTNRP